MKKIFYILLFLTSINQFVFGQFRVKELVGKYKYIHNKYDSASLEIKQDSTFIYYWEWKGLKGITNGKWKIDKKYLYLESDTQPTIKSEKIKDLYFIKAVKDTSKKNVTIQFKDVNGIPIKNAECWVIVSGKLFRNYSDSIGFVSFDLKSIKHISVVAPFAQKGFITYKDKNLNNKFEITLLKVNQRYLYLTNEKLLLNKIEGELFLHETFYDPRATNIFKKL